MINIEDCIKIGQIGKTHNLQGALLLHTEIDLQDELEEPVFLLLDGAPVPFFISPNGINPRNNSSYIIKFDYVDSKEQAEKLIGADVYIDKDLIIEQEENFEISDYGGFKVIDIPTKQQGEVLFVEDFSGNIVFTVSIFEKEILIPHSEEYILEIDHEKQIIKVQIPEDLKELY